MAFIDTRPPCKEPRCPNRAEVGGYCVDHKHLANKRHKRYNKFGRSKAKLEVYNSNRWKKLSKRILKKYPLCTRCEAMGKVTSATLTDHLYGFTGAEDPNAWNEEVLYPLCFNCHAVVTAKERYTHFLSMPLEKAVFIKYDGASPHTKFTKVEL